MDDRKPSAKCACGHVFEVAPEKLFQEIPCPKCGKMIGAPGKAEPPTKTEAGVGTKTDPPKTDGPKPDTTKASTPGTTRRPQFVPKDAPLPAPIPGYTFVKRLGQGGMGDVFLARQESLDRLVAVKLLPPEFAKDKIYVERFMKEARSAGKVTHENIMGAVDVGESAGRYFFVMEYVAGETLYRLIRQQKAIPEPKALDIARQVARGLKHAHQMGLIHRDIKPQNILLTPEGTAKICDFGLATELKSNDARHGEDEENVHTTPAYASPEQCQAQPLDHRTDMYSLGVTLYEMLTGRRPFIASSPRELMTKQVAETPQPPRAVNPALSEGANQLVLKLLKKHKDERPKSYEELIASLDTLLNSASPKTVRRAAPAPAEAAPATPPAPAKKPLGLIIGAAAAAGVVIAILLVFALRKGPAPATAPSSAGNLDPEIQRKLDDMAAIQKNSMGRPGEYAAVRSKWKALEEKYPQWAIFANRRQDFEAAVNAEADAAARDAMEEASRLVQDGRPGEGLAALRRFPAEFSGTPAGTRVAAKTLEIERAVDDRYRDEFQAINSLMAAERLDEARQRLMTLRASSALDVAELRPQLRTQMEDLLRKIDAAIAEARKKPLEPTAKETLPSVKAPETPKTADPSPGPGPGPQPPVTPGVKPPPQLPDPSLSPAAAPHFLVLRTPAERAVEEKRLAAAAYFQAGSRQSAFHQAAAIFLSRDDAAWKLQGAAAEGLQEYLVSPDLNRTEPGGRKRDALQPDTHLKLLELLVRKIAEAGPANIDALQLFACAHLQEVLSSKTNKVDPALLLQAKLAKGPVTDLWGPAASVIRVETAGLLMKPPGLWVARAAETAALAGDFPTRYLGALCAIKDQTFDAAAAIERWKKLGPTGPDAAGWTKFCDAVAERFKADLTCEVCLGQGRYGCSACNSTGGTYCGTCAGKGKVRDASDGGMVTCLACKGRGATACVVCMGAKGTKCVACDGKKPRTSLVGSHYRLILDLGLCDTCGGLGTPFAGVAYPCPGCDGAGRSLENVIKEYSKLPPWVLKTREGRMLHQSLRWLARHQSPEGFWDSSTWTTFCPETGCKAAEAANAKGAGPGFHFEVGLTSLTLAAFLNAGFGPDSPVELGNVSAGLVVRKAIAWLMAHQGPEGLISHDPSPKPVYENNLATWALFTATQLIQPSEAFSEKDRAQLRDSALRALRWALNAQARAGGWGYTVGAASDTWVTSWGATALLAAKDAGVDVPRMNLGYILTWLDTVTDKKDFHLGYAPNNMGKVNLPGNDAFLHHDTLSAFGSLVRLQLEGKPSSTYSAADKQLERDLPNADPLRRDYCYWYFGTVYTAYHEQRRGTAWTQWTQALAREQLMLQDATDTCTLGSFPTAERWCAMGGRPYATAMNALTLTQILGTRPTPPAKK